MKLWLITSEFSLDAAGGISTYARYTVDAWVEAGHRVSVFVRDPAVADRTLSISHPRPGLELVRFGERYANDPTWRLYGVAQYSFQYSQAVADRVAADGPPDVLEAQDYLASSYFLLMRKRALDPRVQGFPVVITVHAPKFVLDAFEEAPVYRLPDYWTGEMERAAIAAADGVVYPSRYVKDHVERRLTAPPSLVVPNPLPLPPPAGGPVEPRVLFVGRLQRLKGVLELFSAMDRLWADGSPATLDVAAGDGWFHRRGESMRAYLERTYADHIAAARLRFHGPLAPQEVGALAASAAVVVVPSLFENFPYAAIEAMGRGQVVVASDAGGQRDLIRPGENGFLAKPTAGALAGAIEEALGLSSDRRAQMGEAARETVERICNPARVTETKIEWFRDLVRRHRDPASFPFVSAVPPLPDPPRTPLTLSVIIPHYNLGAYVDEAVESVLRGSVVPDEVVLVDDASTDAESVARLYRLEDRHDRVRVVWERHRGLPGTRNAAAEAARGRYIAFVDADDRVDPEYFARALEIFDAYDNVGMVGAWVGGFGANAEVWHTWTTGSPYFLYHNIFPVASMVVRRDLFLRHGQNDPVLTTGMEDWDSGIGLWLSGVGGVVIPEPLYQYRLRPDQMSRGRNPASMLQSYRRIVEKRKDAMAPHWAELVGLLNANGPQYVPSHPTAASRWVDLESSRG